MGRITVRVVNVKGGGYYYEVCDGGKAVYSTTLKRDADILAKSLREKKIKGRRR